MNTSRAAVRTLAAIFLVAAALVAAWQLARHRAIEASAREEAANREAPEPPRLAAPRADSIADDAPGNAARWHDRAERVVRARNARLFNADVARLLALPPDEAWPALVDRALAGDLAAGAAALNIATLCRTLAREDGYVSGTRPNVSSKLHSNLPPAWRSFS